MRLSLIAAAALVLTAPAAFAQDGHADHAGHDHQGGAGQYADGLNRMLTATTAGTCPDDVMAAELLAACQGQIAGMAPALASLGAIQSMTFVEAEDTSNGRVETYRVVYAGGQALNWSLGGLVDGKFTVAFTRGE